MYFRRKTADYFRSSFSSIQTLILRFGYLWPLWQKNRTSRFFNKINQDASRAQLEWNDDVTIDCRRARVKSKMKTFCFDFSYNEPAENFSFTTNFTLSVKYFKRIATINELKVLRKDGLLFKGEGFNLNSYIVLYRRLHRCRRQRYSPRR